MSDAPSKPPPKRACDACRVRKVRCSGEKPCSGCTAIDIECTFPTTQGTRRGPRSLRTKTFQQIAQSQSQRRAEDEASLQELESVGTALNENANVPNAIAIAVPAVVSALETPLPPLIATPPAETVPFHRTLSVITPVATLILHLCVYRLRMFPVWPIVAVEDLMAALQKNSTNMEAYALANIVAAATIAQLRQEPLKNSAEVVTAASMEKEVQRMRATMQKALTLNQLRIALFLHYYHENLEAGGIQSLLYLREAITMAQIMGLDKESSYKDLSTDEQQFRKRVLWLLFLTERSVAMLHKLPVVLKTDVSFPAMEYEQEVSILPAFRKLVNFYWIFDKSEAFEVLQSSEHNPQATNQSEVMLLQKKLQEISVDLHAANDIQIVDICVTRAWMSAILWRIATNRGFVCSTTDPAMSISYPTQIATEFLNMIQSLPTSVVEPHGPSMELKTYEIACSLADSIARMWSNADAASWENFDSRNALDQLQNMLSAYRGGHSILVERIKDRLAAFPNTPHVNMFSSPPILDRTNSRGINDGRETGQQSVHSQTFVSNGQGQRSQDYMDFSSASGSANVASPGFSHMHQQQDISYPWDDPIANHADGFQWQPVLTQSTGSEP